MCWPNSFDYYVVCLIGILLVSSIYLHNTIPYTMINDKRRLETCALVAWERPVSYEGRIEDGQKLYQNLL